MENTKRANYGDALMLLLVDRLSVDRATIYRCVQYYDEYPEKVATWRQLTWSHIKVLLGIPEFEAREEYVEKIVHDKLSVKALRELVRTDSGKYPKLTRNPRLVVGRGEPWTYRLVKDRGVVEIDLGFGITIESPFVNIDVNNVIQFNKLKKTYGFSILDSRTSPFYTYKARVVDVIDGDTLLVKIDLGFKVFLKKKLRLKGINTPPIDTRAGKTAVEFVRDRLKGCEFIAIRTYWRDKYARSLADVFYARDEMDLSRLIKTGKFLNQELLDKGFAKKY